MEPKYRIVDIALSIMPEDSDYGLGWFLLRDDVDINYIMSAPIDFVRLVNSNKHQAITDKRLYINFATSEIEITEYVADITHSNSRKSYNEFKDGEAQRFYKIDHDGPIEIIEK